MPAFLRWRWACGPILFCSVLVSGGCSKEPADALDEVRELQTNQEYEESIPLLRKILEEDPSQPEPNHLLGIALFRTGDAARAIWPLGRAAESPDFAVQSGIVLARAMLESRSGEDALNAINRVLEIVPDNIGALEMRLRAFSSMSKHLDALADINRIEELDPENVNIVVLKVMALIQTNAIVEAEKALEAANEKVANTERAMDTTIRERLCAANGLFAFEKGDVEKSEDWFELCLEKFPLSEIVVTEAFNFLQQVGQRRRAVELLQSAYEESKSSAFRMALAKYMAEIGNREEHERLMREEAEENSSVLSWYALGDFYVAREEYDEAAKAFAKALALSGDNPDPMVPFAYADTLVQAGEYKKARKIAASIEDEPLRDMIRGRILLGEGDPEGALEAFEAGIEQWPNNQAARFLAGQAAEQIGDFDRAVSEYRESLRHRKEIPVTEAALRLAKIYQARRQLAPALDAINRYFRGQMDDPAEGHRTAAQIAHQMRRTELATRSLVKLGEISGQAANAATLEASFVAAGAGGPSAAVAAILQAPLDLTDPANVEALRALLKFRAALEDHDAAQTQILAALDADPKEAAFHDLHARVLHRAGHPQDQVRVTFERALDLDAENAQALAGLAELDEAKKPQAAIALYDRATEADPDNPDYPYAAAQLVSASGEKRQAIKRLKKLLTDHPLHALAAKDLAIAYAGEAGDLKLALEYARRAYQFDKRAEVLEILGWVFLLSDESAQAVKALKKAVALQTQSAAPLTRYRLGLALAAQGDRDGARSAFNEVVKAGKLPEAEDARAELARLDAAGES